MSYGKIDISHKILGMIVIIENYRVLARIFVLEINGLPHRSL